MPTRQAPLSYTHLLSALNQTEADADVPWLGEVTLGLSALQCQSLWPRLMSEILQTMTTLRPQSRCGRQGPDLMSRGLVHGRR